MRLTMKAWRMAEAERCGITESAVAMRLARGVYRHEIRTRRVNARVVFVKPKDQ